MHYAAINKFDMANGPGVRVSLFVSGCRRHCRGCFNPEAWDFNYGQEFTADTLRELVTFVGDPKVTGLSILGGEPLEPANRDTVHEICKLIKFLYPQKDIWVWTGYDLLEDFILDLPAMKYIDVLVDGRFEADKKDLTLAYRGSSNQRIIDVPKARTLRCAIRLEGDWK